MYHDWCGTSLIKDDDESDSYENPKLAVQTDGRGLLIASCCLLLGVFSLAPLAAAVPPLPLGVLTGSDWYWWSESSSANLLFAYGVGKRIPLTAAIGILVTWQASHL